MTWHTYLSVLHIHIYIYLNISRAKATHTPVKSNMLFADALMMTMFSIGPRWTRQIVYWIFALEHSVFRVALLPLLFASCDLLLLLLLLCLSCTPSIVQVTAGLNRGLTNRISSILHTLYVIPCCSGTGENSENSLTDGRLSYRLLLVNDASPNAKYY